MASIYVERVSEANILISVQAIYQLMLTMIMLFELLVYIKVPWLVGQFNGHISVG